jgi:hypothetical protein
MKEKGRNKRVKIKISIEVKIIDIIFKSNKYVGWVKK